MSKSWIYKCPGAQTIHGVECETRIVDEEYRDAYCEKGWHESPQAAQEAYLENLEGEMKETAKEAESILDEPEEVAMFENTPQQIYKLAEKGLSWNEIKEATGNKASHLAAKRYAKENDLPYPPKEKA